MRSTFLLSLFLFLSFTSIQAQSDHYFEELLKEKIANVQIRSYIKTIKQKFNSQQDYSEEIDAINQLIKKQQATQLSVSAKSDANFGFGAEPFVVINPNNPDNIVISYMEQDQASLSMPVYYSVDGGQTWISSDFDSNAILSSQIGGFSLGGGDPVLAFDVSGNLHLTWLYVYIQGFSLKMSMFYAYSEDGGSTFIVPDNLSDHIVYEGDLLTENLIDRQWMTTDDDGNGNPNNLYISALYVGNELSASGEIVIVKDLQESGFPSEATLVVPIVNGSNPQFGNVQVDDNGAVHFTCTDIQSDFSGTIIYGKSIDEGANFTTTEIANSTTTVANDNTIPKTIHSRENSANSLAVEGENVYIAWSDMADGTVKSYYSYSNDSGVSWSDPFEFGPSIITGENYHLMPNLSADDGRMSVSWYVINSETMQSDYWYAESLDGGVSLINEQIISDSSTDFVGATEEGNTDFYGDYNTSVSEGCNTYTIWADGSTGTTNVYFAKINSCNVGIAENTIINGSFYAEDIFPNPVENEINLKIYSEIEDQIIIEIIDILGRNILITKTQKLKTGESTLKLSGIDLKAGNYLIKLTNNKHQFLTRILTVK